MSQQALGTCTARLPRGRPTSSVSASQDGRYTLHRLPHRTRPGRAPGVRPPRRRIATSHAAQDDLDLDALLADIEAPALEGEPRYYQESAGGQFENGIAVTFGNDEEALEAMEKTAAIVDRSHWGRIRLAGPDRLSFMQNQSTADFSGIQPGQGTDTVLVTAQARTIDIATALMQDTGLLLIVSPGQVESLVQRMNKYIFPMDKVEVTDISGKCGMLTLMGPGSDELLEGLAAGSIMGKPEGTHSLLNFGGSPVIVVVGTGLKVQGYTFVVDESKTGELWRRIVMLGAVPMGDRVWERARILQGRPAPGSELTEEFNPLEAGLYQEVSLAKGCYIGQETIAKVHNKNAVKQELWGLELSASCAVGDEVFDAEGAKLGAVTSIATKLGGQMFGLAYLRCKKQGQKVDLEGTQVMVGGSPARVQPLPYATREFAPENLPKKEGTKDDNTSLKDEKAAQDAKAAKMKAMQEQLAAYQAQMAAAKKAKEQ